MTTLGMLVLLTAPVSAGETFWAALQPLCGNAYAGKLTRGTEASDSDFAQQSMIMHVAVCTDSEIRIPFHVGENRSRTWVLTRDSKGVQLKHDHRHQDGTEDHISQYGGTTPRSADGASLDFHADRFTAELIPAAANNIWTLAIDPGRIFVYQLRREAEQRYFRVEFDITRKVPVPSPAW